MRKKAANCLFEFWRSLPRAVTHAVTHLSCDGAELSDRLLGQNKPFFFNICTICVCVFCGECGCICMISICVADNQLWLLWLNRSITMNAVQTLWTILPISVWLSSVLPRTSVCDYWLLTAISVKVWPYQCMSGNQSIYVSMYYIQSYFFHFYFLLHKLFLLHVLVVK